MMAVQNIEQRGHPWRGTAFTRTTWMDDMEVPEYDGSQEYLYWVGCTGALVERVLSITSIMSATGAPGTMDSTPEAAAVLNVPPPDPAVDFEAYVAQGVKNARTIGSPAWPWDEDAIRERVIA